MRTLMFLTVLSAWGAELPPQGITTSQWVREDIFAGILGGDMVTFEKGMAKARNLVAADPKNDEARAWLAAGQMLLASRTYRAGTKEEGAAQLAMALEMARESLAHQDSGAVTVIGAAWVLLADRLPEEKRPPLYEEGRRLFAILRQAQNAHLDRMPVHFRAELLAGQAQAAMRLGLRDEANQYLSEIVTKLPNTPYAKTAAQWLAEPSAASKSQLVCQSCHEPNRLENRLKAIAAK